LISNVLKGGKGSSSMRESGTREMEGNFNSKIGMICSREFGGRKTRLAVEGKKVNDTEGKAEKNQRKGRGAVREF